MFQTSTIAMKGKLVDALWPLTPENQPNALNPKNPLHHKRPSSLTPNELYGPLWIMITLIIELLIMGHVTHLLRIELGYGQSSGQPEADQELVGAIVARLGGGKAALFDASAANANAALSKIMTLAFLITLFFTVVPLAAYFTFRSSGRISDETSYTRLIQVYGYSMAVFIPIVAVYSAMSPFHRVQWVLLLAGAALASFYQYKEMIEESKRFLTYSTFRKLAGGVLFSTLLFVWLLRFYFISS